MNSSDFSSEETRFETDFVSGYAVAPEPMTNEQEVRRDVVLQLLKNNNTSRSTERLAEKLTEFILEGSKTSGRLYGRLPVWLPGQDGHQPQEARASVTEDGYLLVEFRDSDLRDEILNLIKKNDPVEIINLSFNYRPSVPANTNKEI